MYRRGFVEARPGTRHVHSRPGTSSSSEVAPFRVRTPDWCGTASLAEGGGRDSSDPEPSIFTQPYMVGRSSLGGGDGSSVHASQLHHVCHTHCQSSPAGDATLWCLDAIQDISVDRALVVEHSPAPWSTGSSWEITFSYTLLRSACPRAHVHGHTDMCMDLRDDQRMVLDSDMRIVRWES